MSIQHLLRRWDLFSHFSEPQLDLLGQCMSRSRFPAGVMIVREGEPTVDAYLIESGGIRILRKTPYGSFNLAELEPGDFFGETSFIDRNTRSGDAVTTSDTDVLALNPLALRR